MKQEYIMGIKSDMKAKENDGNLSLHDLPKIVGAQAGILNDSNRVESSNDLEGESERFYRQETKIIIDKSIELLGEEHKGKQKLRKTLSVFFLVLLAVQFLILALILFFNDKISNELSITYITSVFVETLGIIVLMVKFAFDNSKEVEIVNVLNSFMSSFQKYNSKKQ